MTIADRDMMGGLAKGLSIIETFTADRPRQTLSQAAAAAGLDRATARRCLLTLAHAGYADWDGKYFTLTPRVLRLGTACLATMPLPQIVQPLLDRLSEQIGESTSVSILDGAEIVYVARAAQRKVMSIALMPGSRLPAYCTSMGRVLLSFLPPAEAQAILGTTPLPALTRHTLTDPQAIMALLPAIRTAGYAVNDQEVELGLHSLAVPLRNAKGKVLAALNVGLAASGGQASGLADRFLASLQAVQQDFRALIS